MAFIKFKSIKTKFLVMDLTLITTLVIVFITTFGYFTERILKDVIYESNINNVQTYGKIIGNWLNERKTEIEIYSENPMIETMDWDLIQPYIVKEMGKKTDVYRLFLISDLNGDYHTDLSKNAGNISDRHYFNQALQGKTVISDPVVSKSTKGYISVVAAPIRNNKGYINGIFAGAIDLVKFHSFIEEFKGNSKFNDIYIVDKKGLIITHSNKALIMKENITEASSFINSNLSKVSPQMLLNPHGFVEYSNDREVNFVYYSEIPNTNGWKIIKEIPMKTLYDPLYMIKKVFGIIALGCLLVGVLVSLKLANDQSKPIQDLKNVFDKAASGNLNIRANDEGRDELGAAAKSFNIMMDRISHMTYYDPLTGLSNRESFTKSLKGAIDYYKDDDNKLGMLMLSLDKFKGINNIYGHFVGDELLKEIAHRIEGAISPEDTLSRISGDEFGILFLDKNKESTLIRYIETILNEIRKPFRIEENTIYIVASIGISLYPQDGEDVVTLLKNASIAKSYVKDMGGDNYRLHNEAMNRELNEQVKVSKLLYNALDKQELFLNYQPFICMKTGKIIGMEALARWNNSELGFVSPCKFIPLAEQSGQIIEIGKWVLREACRQNKEWQNRGFKSIPVSVNVSAKQLESEDFIESVREILDEVGLHPRYLELEITEGVAMSNITNNFEKLSQLHSMGIDIAIDDFGTGYSSLNYLTKFPISTLKIDQSFIREIPNNISSMQIASTIISMAKNLNLSTTAEGIETKEQLEFIHRESCDKVQGYLFSKPISSDDFEIILNENKKYLT